MNVNIVVHVIVYVGIHVKVTSAVAITKTHPLCTGSPRSL